MEWLLSPETFYPQLSPEMYTFLRMGYSIITILTLAITLPNRRFFLSERWGGYAESARDVDWIQNPIAYPLIQIIWFASLLLMLFGVWSVWAALVNLLLSRYFFVYMRWKGVARGMGAPGYMTYWMGLGIFLLEFTNYYSPDLFPLALLAIQVDYAFIMLSAGFYKLNSGYAHQNGMELGAANPQWGFWPKFYGKRPTDDFFMQTFNHLAWGLEILGAVLMLIAPFRFIGGFIIFLSFAFLITQIRLGWLAHLVMLCSAVFFHPGSLVDLGIAEIITPTMIETTNPDIAIPIAVEQLLQIILWTYIILLPLMHIGLSYNFYMRKRLPEILQITLERYTNFFGLIVWRVFSQDLVNFYPLIHFEDKNGGNRRQIMKYGWAGGGFLNRYNHVAESIVLTTLFTTLKYYPSNDIRFQDRVLRYCRTLNCPADQNIVFEYYSLQRNPENAHVEHILVSEFVVDLQAETVKEVQIHEAFSTKDVISISPVHEAGYPGSYAPKQVQTAK